MKTSMIHKCTSKSHTVIFLGAKKLNNLEIIHGPHAFVGMLVSLNMDINAILVQQVLNAISMSQWDANTNLCIQCIHIHMFRTKDFS